ncbi:type IV pilin N-terminal domain-containing protein [Haloarcula montana]|uniref:type IV pilin N-terminal domain-containing protein n=1 Tax=Haloarcula montana TaxID=3111776 RepID=UPI002D769738|nr:type IV pilin N-terminal domain-containing protein [Haloarcula sp. GH36]
MKLQQLFDDDDAVSPVIGVILMVAITVILAAVIATFVLGLGDQVSNTAPQATFSFDYEAAGGGSGELTITHDGGDSISETELYVRGAGGNGGQWSGTVGSSSEVRAGNSWPISGVSDSATVRVVYQSNDGGNSATLGRWTGPNA